MQLEFLQKARLWIIILIVEWRAINYLLLHKSSRGDGIGVTIPLQIDM